MSNVRDQSELDGPPASSPDGDWRMQDQTSPQLSSQRPRMSRADGLPSPPRTHSQPHDHTALTQQDPLAKIAPLHCPEHEPMHM